MKNLIAAFTMLFAAQVMAGGKPMIIEPNMYSCKGNGIQIGFTTTSFTGSPTFSVSGRDKLNSMKPTVAKTPAGKLVSAYDENIQDVTRSYSLLLPYVGLDNQTESATFKTVAILSTTGHNFGRPRPAGVYTHNKFIGLVCKATRVFF